MKKVYSIPKIIKQRKSYTLVEFYPIYDDSHLIVHGNEFGLIPIPFSPHIVKYENGFDIECYIMSDYRRRKWQKLSGRRAYIYVLYYDADKIPIYIGSTKNEVKKRLWQHVRYSYRSVYKKSNKKQVFPKIAILCECPEEFQFDEEKRWILGAKGVFNLKNKVHNR